MPTLTKIPPGVIASVKPKTAEIIKATGSDVTHVWGAGPNPDHNNLRCVDLMVRTIAAGNRVADYVWRNRARLGVRLIIWNGRIIRAYSKPGIPAGTWARYTGPNPHRDHPHVEFDSSGYRAPSGGSKPTPAKPAAPSKAKTDTWVVTASSLFYRSAPLPGGRNRGSVKRGRKIAVTESKVITRGGRREGWIKSRYGNWFCAYQGDNTYAKRS